MARILIADDEPEVIQFCTYALKKTGHTLLAAKTGPEALETLKTELPDLLVLDVMLPGMDGYTLGLKMAGEERLSRIPVVVISAVRPAEGLFAKLPQVKTFLPKPFTPEALAGVVESALAAGVR